MTLQDGQFPTVENCDVNNPEERFLPYMVGIPGMKGAPLPFPVGYLRQVSRRISEAMTVECRVALMAEAPVIKYRRPRSDSPHWFADPGAWVDINEPDPDGPTVRDLFEALPSQEQAALAEIALENQPKKAPAKKTAPRKRTPPKKTSPRKRAT